MKKASTSTQEQIIFYYIKEFFPDAINRYKFPYGKRKWIEADIFIPSLRIAVEYDGYYWHKSKKEKELFKNTFFEAHDIYVIRIRDKGLDSLLPFNGIELWIKHKINGEGLFINQCITEAMHAIADRCDDKKLAAKLRSYFLSRDQYWGDYPDIMSVIYTENAENSITAYRESLYWDKENNGRLKPQNVPEKDNIQVWLKCPNGYERIIPVNSFQHLTKDRSLISTICPLYNNPSFCETMCDYYTEQLTSNVVKYINGERVTIGDELTFMRTVAECGKAIESAVDLRLENDKSKNKRFNKLFIDNSSYQEDFLRGFELSVRGTSILQKLQRIYEIYDSMRIRINPIGYDGETSKAWIDFYLWMIRQETYDSSKLIIMIDMIHSLWMSDVSDEFKYTAKEVIRKEVTGLKGTLLRDVMSGLGRL